MIAHNSTAEISTTLFCHLNLTNGHFKCQTQESTTQIMVSKRTSALRVVGEEGAFGCITTALSTD